MSWQKFQDLRVPQITDTSVKRRYSVTTDILSFKRCPRQYGHFVVRGYEPAHAVQIYYGTLIHQVLDRAYMHYAGLRDKKTEGRIPTDEDIEYYFNEVDTALRIRGIRSVRAFAHAAERQAALRRLKKFNQIEGYNLYPRIKDTEHHLQSHQSDYLLHGTVDVLADVQDWLPGMPGEIWDYKGGHPPDPRYPNSEELRQYKFQMLVYAELYRERNGVYPEKAILYFLGALDAVADSSTRPSNALIEVPLDEQSIQHALEDFTNTVKKIEDCRQKEDWPAPHAGLEPSENTCNICDIRWNCRARKGEYQMRYP